MEKERYESGRAALEQLRSEGYQWVVVNLFVGPPKHFYEATVPIEEYLERGLEMTGMESGLRPVLEQSRENPESMTLKIDDGGLSGGEVVGPSVDECCLERNEEWVWVVRLPSTGGEFRTTKVYRERPSET
jgi:hypothetical protein